MIYLQMDLNQSQSSYETWYNEGEKVRFLNPPTSKAFQFSQLVNDEDLFWHNGRSVSC